MRRGGPGLDPAPDLERLGEEIVAALLDPGIVQETHDLRAEPLPLRSTGHDAFSRAKLEETATGGGGRRRDC